MLRARAIVCCLSPAVFDDDLSGMGRMKLSGDARRPTTRAREKLIVAQVEMEAPAKRREKDCMTWSCWELTRMKRTRRKLR